MKSYSLAELDAMKKQANNLTEPWIDEEIAARAKEKPAESTQEPPQAKTKAEEPAKKEEPKKSYVNFETGVVEFRSKDRNELKDRMSKYIDDNNIELENPVVFDGTYQTKKGVLKIGENANTKEFYYYLTKKPEAAKKEEPKSNFEKEKLIEQAKLLDQMIPHATNEELELVAKNFEDQVKKLTDPQAKELAMKFLELIRNEQKSRTQSKPGAPVKSDSGFKQTMYQGRGASLESIYGERAVKEGRAVPILGKGSYYAFDEESAKVYGTVTKHEVELKKPFIVDSDKTWRNLLEKADTMALDSRGREFYDNPEKIVPATKKLQEYLKINGYDGVVVEIPRSADMNSKGESIKGIRESFGHSQVMKFSEPKKEGPKNAVPVKGADSKVQGTGEGTKDKPTEVQPVDEGNKEPVKAADAQKKIEPEGPKLIKNKIWEYKATTTQKIPYKAEIMEDYGDGTVHISFTNKKGQLEFATVPKSKLAVPKSVQSKNMNIKDIDDYSKESGKPAKQIRAEAKEFEKIVLASPISIHYTMQLKDAKTNSESIENSIQIKAALKHFAEYLGAESPIDFSTPVERSKYLQKLKIFMASPKAKKMEADELAKYEKPPVAEEPVIDKAVEEDEVGMDSDGKYDMSFDPEKIEQMKEGDLLFKKQEAISEPWQMTMDEYVAARRKEVPDFADNDPEAKQMQEDSWQDEYLAKIVDWPRDAEIPMNVLKSLTPDQRNQVIKFNEKARKTWSDAVVTGNAEPDKTNYSLTSKDDLIDIKTKSKKIVEGQDRNFNNVHEIARMSFFREFEGMDKADNHVPFYTAMKDYVISAAKRETDRYLRQYDGANREMAQMNVNKFLDNLNKYYDSQIELFKRKTETPAYDASKMDPDAPLLTKIESANDFKLTGPIDNSIKNDDQLEKERQQKAIEKQKKTQEFLPFDDKLTGKELYDEKQHEIQNARRDGTLPADRSEGERHVYNAKSKIFKSIEESAQDAQYTPSEAKELIAQFEFEYDEVILE